MSESVESAVEHDLELLGPKAAESTLAATALALARGIDGGSSLAQMSLAAKTLVDTMRELRALAPPKPEEDEIERARNRRVARLAGKAAAGTPSPS